MGNVETELSWNLPSQPSTAPGSMEHSLTLRTVGFSGSAWMARPTSTTAHLVSPMTKSPEVADGLMRFLSALDLRLLLMKRAESSPVLLELLPEPSRSTP